MLVLAAAVAGSVMFARPASAHRPLVDVAAIDDFDVGMLHVEHVGRPGRTPIILIPALFCGSWQWQRQAAALSDTYDVYALTLPGFDGRARDTGGDLMNRAASDLATLIRTRKLDRPIVIGHSLGGTLAIYFAARHPGHARAIIAAEGGYPVAPTLAGRERRVRASTAPYVGVDRGVFGDSLRKHMLQYVITSTADVDRMERLATRSDPAAVVDWMKAALLQDLTPELKNVHIPLTEIVPFDSTLDPYQGFPSEAAKRVAYTKWLAHTREGSVIMIAHARHFVMIDQPAVFDSILYSTIARSAALNHGANGVKTGTSSAQEQHDAGRARTRSLSSGE